MTSLREIENKDLPMLIDMGAQMHKESGYSVIQYSREKIQGIFANAIILSDVLGLASEDDEGIYGLMLAAVSEHWCSTDRVAYDLALYVKPERRGGMAAIRMIRYYVRWAQERGAKMISLGTSTGINSERVSKLYERLGFKKVGYAFQMEN